MKIYLSLPISNYDIHVRIEYAKNQALQLKEIFRCEVFNPLADVDVDNQQPYQYYMARDITELLKCDTVVLCPGWYRSNGCKTEYYAARYNNISLLLMNDAGHVFYDPAICNEDFLVRPEMEADDKALKQIERMK